MKTFSIVWLSARRIVRADFRPGARGMTLVDLREDQRPASDEPGTLVDAALRLSSRRARRVAVLSSELSAQVLEVGQDIVQSVPEADLAQVLAFEAETLTGLSAFESVISHQPLPGTPEERRFWIVQAQTVQRDQIAEAVRRYGARLLGVTHPAGLLRPLPATSGPWQRLEVWDSLTVRVGTRSKSGTRTAPDVESLAGSSARWKTAVDSSGLDGEQVLMDDPASPPGTLNLHDRAVLEQWLTAWADELARTGSTCALIRPAPQPLSPGQRATIALSLAAVSVLGCAGMWLLNQSRATVLAQELEQLQAPGRVAAELETQIAAAKKKQSELKTQAAAAQKQRAAVSAETAQLRLIVDRQWTRTARMMELLAKHCTEDVMVQSIAAQGADTEVTGLCLRLSCVQALARALGQGLSPMELEVLPAELTATSRRADGGPWKFRIVIRERSLSSLPKT